MWQWSPKGAQAADPAESPACSSTSAPGLKGGWAERTLRSAEGVSVLGGACTFLGGPSAKPGLWEGGWENGI